MPGKFVISLDFELLWGVRDHANRESYGANILGARKAIPRILELFEAHDISATWATVGFLFCSSRDELMACLPSKELRPAYEDDKLSAYNYLNEVGLNELEDPFYYGASLIDRIQQTQNQEIGTHTLSHYYCLEPGQREAQFEADLEATITLARRHKIELSPIVFPRNQFAEVHLPICRKFGLTSYRGTPNQWVYRSTMGSDQTPMRRVGRLLDAHTGLLGDTSFVDDTSLPANVPASQFLRPCVGRLASIHSQHRLAVKRGMTRAARTGRGYHLWWHPHNFGQNMEANLESLKEILFHYRSLRDDFGIVSCTMSDAVK